MKFTSLIVAYGFTSLVTASNNNCYARGQDSRMMIHARDHHDGTTLTRRQASGPHSSRASRDSRRTGGTSSTTATAQGPGHFKTVDGDGRYRQHEIPTGRTQRSSAVPYNHETCMQVKTLPKSGGKRWPTKARGSGTSILALLEAPEKGNGHILLTAPDRSPKHVHVPGGGRKVVSFGSDIPGAARAQATVSRGGEINIITGSGTIDHEAIRVGHSSVVKLSKGDVNAGLPTQYGSIPSSE